jgi:hypothetical protein
MGVVKGIRVRVTGCQLLVVVPTRKRFDSDGDKGYSASAFC